MDRRILTDAAKAKEISGKSRRRRRGEDSFVETAKKRVAHLKVESSSRPREEFQMFCAARPKAALIALLDRLLLIRLAKKSAQGGRASAAGGGGQP